MRIRNGQSEDEPNTIQMRERRLLFKASQTYMSAMSFVSLLIGFGERNRWFGMVLMADERVSGRYRWLGLIYHTLDPDGALNVLMDEAARWFDGCGKVQLDIV